MSAAVRRLLVVLAVLALAGAVGACGSASDDGSGGGDADRATTNRGGAANNGGGANGGGKLDEEEEAEIRGKEPTANNEVLLGARFFGKQPADFGAVAVGKTRTISFTLKSGGTSRTINGTSIGGAHAGDFSLAPGSCTDGVTVDADESCTLLITFRPSAEGPRMASLHVAVDPGVPGGRALTGGRGLTRPRPPPAVAPPPAGAAGSGQTDDTTGGTRSGTDDAGGGTAPTQPQAPGAEDE